MRWYSYDPFAHIAREDATVGALRRAAGDHDISIKSYDQGRFANKTTDLAELVAKATA
jgi:hypothetical protein